MVTTILSTPRRHEGVEENKEDDTAFAADHHCSPQKSYENDQEEREHGFQAQLHNLASFFLGSCGQAMESLVQGQGCRWPQQAPQPSQPYPTGGPAAAAHNHHATHPSHLHYMGAVPPTAPQPPPLSIADELRQLAAREGRPFPPPQPRAADIPRFLGEEAVHSFEDDNISAISQHTLEEMALNGIVHPVSERIRKHKETHDRLQREQQEQRDKPPATIETDSSSPSSESQRRRSSAEEEEQPHAL